MLYHFFTYLNNRFDFPGSGLFEFISFKAALAVITSLVITLVFGGKLIRFLHQKQVGETVRDLGLDGQLEKTGTPTMGGIIILAGILIPTLLFADLSNIYIQLMLISTVLLGAIGFVDDYIKVFKKNKEGLAGKFKVFGQIAVGLIVASSLYFHQDVTIKSKVNEPPVNQLETVSEEGSSWVEMRSTKTTIPFIKNNEFDYSWLLVWLNKDLEKYSKKVSK